MGCQVFSGSYWTETTLLTISPMITVYKNED